ncbi:hypothetical protein M9H77_01870 [Catharanthus roseus]|uniref:Uncharacterized protein n=1 Tax=Catharanthus roseus TaxID=4058 RepID=A0ACC0C777_CATRO|nr:hypothetical protein M9H77_01870 [Catharanthus roseus]
MTIDDDSSIYVGGLPYDATEESVRKVFDIYGAVVAVKIINDRTVGGKCYGFVTFTNPRSAMHAIKDMDGRTVDGRVVRVNEVKTRGSRSSFGREGFHRSSERGIGSDRNRDREKDHDYDRDLDHDNYRERSRDYDQERERRYDQLYDNDRMRDRPVNRDGGQNRDLENFARQRERIHNYDRERDGDADREMQRTPDHRRSRERDDDEITRILDRSYSNDRGKRDRSSESSDNDQGEVAKQLQISNQKLFELQKEISEMEELAEEKNKVVLKLQEKSQKLEDSLSAARRFTSFRQNQLSKLHKCYLQIRDCKERLKSYEQELQSLVDSTTAEVGYGDGMGTKDGILTNGSGLD